LLDQMTDMFIFVGLSGSTTAVNPVWKRDLHHCPLTRI